MLEQKGQFGKLLLMGFLDGDEWSVDCLADKDSYMQRIQRRKFIAQKCHNQYIDNNPEKTMYQQLTTYLKLNAQFNIQFRAGKMALELLEINARPSGGIDDGVCSGMLPYLLLRSCLDQVCHQ